MPLTSIKYANCKIYRFVCKDLSVSDSYVGHTTDIIRRKARHKNACVNTNNKSYNLKVYRKMRETGGWTNWIMLVIEDYPCNNEYEARARERYWCEELHAELNSNVPNRTRDEWIADNYGTEYGYYKPYYLANHAKINEKFICDCGGKYTRQGIYLHRKTKRHQLFISRECIKTDAEATTDSEENSTL